ncbi:hypothetical protein B0H67DRAFT_566460 [Lasiosphaeris hirsuta]|uniref:Myb/SANT-like domain-containing protein n=1 Tax=Lasiosphaeris hirsuta TaxID=260670 RepID=A0AA40BD50_9PEZI|nr:hypothetical protein B0H67DRAFT_566460 [Lasiosphaeris hirsuta]
MTAQVMMWFNECKARGFFNSSKKKDYGPAWEYVLPRCKEAWPRYPWSKEALSNKHFAERRRFTAWKVLLEYSGVSYDWELHLPIASEATWEQFFKRFNTPTRPVTWLRKTPLGDEKVYESVFWREHATGGYILEAADVTQEDSVGFSQRESQDLSLDRNADDSGRDNPDRLDTDDSDNEESDSLNVSQAISQRSTSLGPVANTTRRLTLTQQRQLDTDADITPAVENQPAVAVPTSSRRSNKDSRESEAVVIGRSMREATEIIAGLPGARDLALAVEDLQAEFIGKTTDEEMLYCCEYLRKEPMIAAMWLKLSARMKRLYVERWKVVGPVE